MLASISAIPRTYAALGFVVFLNVIAIAILAIYLTGAILKYRNVKESAGASSTARNHIQKYVHDIWFASVSLVALLLLFRGLVLYALELL